MSTLVTACHVAGATAWRRSWQKLNWTTSTTKDIPRLVIRVLPRPRWKSRLTGLLLVVGGMRQARPRDLKVARHLRIHPTNTHSSLRPHVPMSTRNHHRNVRTGRNLVASLRTGVIADTGPDKNTSCAGKRLLGKSRAHAKHDMPAPLEPRLRLELGFLELIQ